MNIVIFSCSLSPTSRSFRLAQFAQERLRGLNAAAELVDLRQWNLPLCDGGSVYEDENVKTMRDRVERADALILSSPVYNYDANAVAKNLIELTGRTWTNKVVGFIYSAGGQGSYMSPMALANSLMLDFRCLVVPRFVYATSEQVGEDGRIADVIEERLDQLCGETVRIAAALAATPAG